MLYILEGRVRHDYGEGLAHRVEHTAGDFIFIEPGVPHEVYNLSDTEPVVAVVARSSADEWDRIVEYMVPENGKLGTLNPDITTPLARTLRDGRSRPHAQREIVELVLQAGGHRAERAIGADERALTGGVEEVVLAPPAAALRRRRRRHTSTPSSSPRGDRA